MFDPTAVLFVSVAVAVVVARVLRRCDDRMVLRLLAAAVVLAAVAATAVPNSDGHSIATTIAQMTFLESTVLIAVAGLVATTRTFWWAFFLVIPAVLVLIGAAALAFR